MKNILIKIKKFTIKRYKLLLTIVIISLGIGLFLYRRSQADKIELIFQTPTRQNLTKTLEVSGFIDARERVKMRFAAGGKVIYLGAQEGDWVKKWQTIATIDKRSLKKSLKKNLNLYLKERTDWDQQIDNITDRTIDKTEQRTVSKNQLDLDNTILDVEIQDIAITNTTLNAPFAGILVSSPTNVTGIWLLATDVFELVNPKTLVFKASVDEADISLVKTGQLANISLDAYDNLKLVSNVKKIAYKSSTSTSGTVFVVEFSLTDPTTPIEKTLDAYRLGMNGDAEIILEEKNNVLTIPLIAIREEDEKTYVDVKTGKDTFGAREIKIGLETDEDVEVLSGLGENDEILIPQ